MNPTTSRFPDPLSTTLGRWFVFILLILMAAWIAYLVALSRPQPLHIIDQAGSYATDGTYVYYMDQPILGANPATFQVLPNGFTKDAKHVYSGLHILPDAVPASFVPVGSSYAKDSAHVYYYDGSIVAGADPASFAMVGGSGYAKDTKTVFYDGSVLLGADAATFSSNDPYRTGYDAHDATHLYESGQEISAKEAKDNLDNYGH